MTEKIEKMVLEKYSTNYPKSGKFPFEEGGAKIIIYYSGEILNGKPHGKGISEKYVFDTSDTKYINQKKFNSILKKYYKNLLCKSRGYELRERYEGNWKSGKKDGKGEKTEYLLLFDIDEGIFVNKDGSGVISEKKIGNYKNNKKQGKFKLFNNVFGWYTLNYKNGKPINNPVKMNKKNDLNDHEMMQSSSIPWDKLDISILKRS